MTTLLLRLAGPMQSWGTHSRFDQRDTGLEPSKSGVIGLLCAALGRQRESPVDDLSLLRMAVRADREGQVGCDYQTAAGVLKADAAPGRTGSSRTTSELENAQSWRYYLADALFLVGLEGDRATLEAAWAALAAPIWPLYLGRKSYVPSPGPWLPDGFSDDRLLPSLARYPFLGRGAPPKDGLRYVIEAADGAVVMDQPVGPFSERTFGTRRVRTAMVPYGEVPDVPLEA